MKFIKTPVKGMCDMLPADMRMREHVFGMIKESYAKYGFMQIETPVMEHIENLTSKQGGDNETGSRSSAGYRCRQSGIRG